MFLQKSEEWIYEKEQRVILRLEQADKAIIYNLDELANEKIKNEVLSAKWTKYDEKEERHEIYLTEIDDESLRYVVFSYLANLSRNHKNIYLMKLDSSAISHCLFGLNSSLKISDIVVNYAQSTGYFEFWRALKNNAHYCLEFEQI